VKAIHSYGDYSLDGIAADNVPQQHFYMNEFDILHAAKESDIDRIKQLISAGAPIDVRTETGWTPLMVAATEDSPEIIKLVSIDLPLRMTIIIITSLKFH
jgi:ankyrin repeat protein